MVRNVVKSSGPIIALGLLAGLTACQFTNSQSSTETTIETTSPDVTQVHNTSELVMNINQQLQFSTQDLSRRLNIDEDAIRIKNARQITWSSGALGCPKPGVNYIQALVPGVLILLEANDEIFGYHAQENQKPFHCPTGQAVIPDSMQKEDLV